MRKLLNHLQVGYIIYDDSLQILDDGSLIGKIRNGGEDIFEKFRIYALIKDKMMS